MKDKRKLTDAVEHVSERLRALDRDPAERLETMSREERERLISRLTARLDRSSSTWRAICARDKRDPDTLESRDPAQVAWREGMVRLYGPDRSSWP